MVWCPEGRQDSDVLTVSPCRVKHGGVWCGVLKEDRTVMC